MLKWYKEAGQNNDVVISSRVRLARNLKDYSFSAKLSEKQASELVEKVKAATPLIEGQASMKFYSCSADVLGDTEKTAMVERHIISPLLVAKEQSTGLILSSDESISIMINEEDHIRIQSITGGMNIEEAFQAANKIDDITNEIFDFAFHEKYGYLTSCPTNVGTGLRASYMMFLPALTAAGKIIKLAEELGQYGIALRGTYGEASKSVGSLYQISNQKTLGSTEKEIMDSLDRIVWQVMKQERRQREYILTNNYDEFEDKVHRSYGVLKYAKQLSSADAMALLAQLKLGIDMNLIHLKENYNVHELMMEIQPGNLQCQLDKNVGSVQRDKYRADYIRKKLPEPV
ncbi:protein arginine kinase [Anaerocolumna sp. MB42-C2]|uniref:protein arginine kinase n=1 Tax=Anaerocolumna sp. MB42-C2 TaxID=3070997 RepID=UPI0027E0203C|nr:protein arginine kinase [Anaerocolumna sp. MB42-C2]WMJ89629.1 protein arginine kinase [Anaerocolumna sp. MB42-C2]